jgi:hypothetical protein
VRDYNLAKEMRERQLHERQWREDREAGWRGEEQDRQTQEAK